MIPYLGFDVYKAFPFQPGPNLRARVNVDTHIFKDRFDSILELEEVGSRYAVIFTLNVRIPFLEFNPSTGLGAATTVVVNFLNIYTA